MERYDIHTYDEYLHILALYRNSRAIEAQNARQRFKELNEATATIEKTRLSVMRRLQDRYAKR